MRAISLSMSPHLKALQASAFSLLECDRNYKSQIHKVLLMTSFNKLLFDFMNFLWSVFIIFIAYFCSPSLTQYFYANSIMAKRYANFKRKLIQFPRLHVTSLSTTPHKQLPFTKNPLRQTFSISNESLVFAELQNRLSLLLNLMLIGCVAAR